MNSAAGCANSDQVCAQHWGDNLLIYRLYVVASTPAELVRAVAAAVVTIITWVATYCLQSVLNTDWTAEVVVFWTEDVKFYVASLDRLQIVSVDQVCYGSSSSSVLSFIHTLWLTNKIKWTPLTTEFLHFRNFKYAIEEALLVRQRQETRLKTFSLTSFSCPRGSTYLFWSTSKTAQAVQLWTNFSTQ